MPKSALLLTWSGDAYTPDRVAEGLSRRGVHPIRVDTDLFPTELPLRWSLDGAGLAHGGEGPLEGVDLAEVAAVWWRRFWQPRLPDELDPAHAAQCVKESWATLRGLFRTLPGARHVNPPGLEQAAEDKLWQLARARDVGLSCPETLITNDPAAVLAFYERREGRIITKMLTPYSRSMAGDTEFVYTSRVQPEDLDALDGLQLCPMVFQEEVPRVREHRLIWVGGRILSGALPTGEQDGVDWRPQLGLRWERSRVPEEIARGASALMARLGLVYGAFDFIEKPDGSWVFLEVNPAGEWGMLERDLDLPIGDAIAAAMLGEHP